MNKNGSKPWEKISGLKADHPFLNSLATPYLYIPKMFYIPPGETSVHVSFFESELKKGIDIYTEMVDRDYNSEDPSRTLYKWSFNEFWATQYKKTTQGPLRYLVPVDELLIQSNEIVNTEQDYECTNGDCDMSAMTMRDLVAIWLKKPCSHKPWLNSILEVEKNK